MAALVPIICQIPDVSSDSRVFTIRQPLLRAARIRATIIIGVKGSLKSVDNLQIHLKRLSRFIDALRLVKFLITSRPEQSNRS
jgi:hypothetical protein